MADHVNLRYKTYFWWDVVKLIVFRAWLGRAMVLGSFQCRGILVLWHMVGQGPAVLAAGSGCVSCFFLFFFCFLFFVCFLFCFCCCCCCCFVLFVCLLLFFCVCVFPFLPFIMPHLLGDDWTYCNIVVSAVITQR